MRADEPVGAHRRSGASTSISAPSCCEARGCAGRAGGGRSRRRPAAARLARPRRASSGPASRNEARIRRAELLVELVLASTSGGVDAHLVRAGPLDVGAEVGEQLEHRLDVADPRHVRERHRLVGEQARGEDRQRAVLVPRGADAAARAAGRPRSRRTRQLETTSATAVCGHGGEPGYPTARRGARPASSAWETLTRYTKSEALLRHALAVEAVVGALRARSSARTRSSGASTALLHDFDYEIHPTLDKHPQDGAPILREEGYPEEVVEAVLSHAEHLEHAARHAAEEDALRLRRAVGLRPRVRARAARRDRRRSSRSRCARS